MNDTNTPEELCPVLCFQIDASSMQSHHALKNFLLKQQQESCAPHSMIVSHSAEHPPCLGHGTAALCWLCLPATLGSPRCAQGQFCPPSCPCEISQATLGHSESIYLRETFRQQVLRAKYQQCLLLSSGAGAAGSCRLAARAGHGSGLPHGPGDRKTIHKEIRHNPSMF